MTESNFLIEVRLGSPVISDGYLTLDSILAAALYAKTGDLEVAHGPLPLAKREGVWCGSALFFRKPYVLVPIDRVASLKGPEDLSPDAYAPSRKKYTPIDQQRGPYKAGMDTYKGVAAESAYWFGRGDLLEVVDLVRLWIPGLGRKQSTGSGAILSVQGVKIDDDYSWMGPAGQVMRPIPMPLWIAAGGSDEVPSEVVGWRPPYSPSSTLWTKQHPTLCAIPFERGIDESEVSQLVPAETW